MSMPQAGASSSLPSSEKSDCRASSRALRHVPRHGLIPCPGGPYRAFIHPPASRRSHAPQPACSVRHLQRIHPTLLPMTFRTINDRIGGQASTQQQATDPIIRSDDALFHLRAPCICPPCDTTGEHPASALPRPTPVRQEHDMQSREGAPGTSAHKKTEGLPRKGKAFSKMRIATKGYSRTTTSRSVLSTS